MIARLGLFLLLLMPLAFAAPASHAAQVACACCACVGPHQKDANAGKADAQLEVSRCYQSDGRAPSCGNEPGKAAYWLDRAARAGNHEAQHLMGWIFVRGAGVALNLESAVRWWKISASGGYAPAQFDAAEALELGLGVPVDPRQAAQYYTAAQRQGYGKFRQAHPELPKLRDPCSLEAGPSAATSMGCRVSRP